MFLKIINKKIIVYKNGQLVVNWDGEYWQPKESKKEKNLKLEELKSNKTIMKKVIKILNVN